MRPFDLTWSVSCEALTKKPRAWLELRLFLVGGVLAVVWRVLA